jgi:iron(III) transport system substrate-binding protein
VPVNPEAKVHDLVKPYRDVKLVDYDFAWAGDPKVRKEIIERFQREIVAARK